MLTADRCQLFASQVCPISRLRFTVSTFQNQVLPITAPDRSQVFLHPVGGPGEARIGGAHGAAG